MTVALWVVALVAAILAFQAVIWTFILLWLRRRNRRNQAEFDAELAASGETVRRGPESALYRGGSGGYSGVNGNGTIVLTDRRLHFRKATGGRIEVPLDAISAVREAKTFRGSWRGGRMNLILQLHGGAEVGFIVRDHPAWMAAMQAAIRP